MDGTFAIYALIIASIGCGVIALSGMIAGDPQARTLELSILKRGSELERFLVRIGERFVSSNQSHRDQLDALLLQAGYESPQAAATFYGARIASAVAFAAIAAALLSLTPLPMRQSISAAALAAVAGFIAPLFYCKRRRASNQTQITQSLPDMLDLMLVCSEAGLGLEMSIARVSEEIAPTWPLLASHLDHVGRELRTGRSKLDALKGLADRTGTKEVVSLVRLLVQSDALGTSVATTLRIYADEMRAHRMLAAEEMAHKISAKLSLVLVGCFLPAVLIAVIAPVIFTIVHTWSGLHL